MEDKKNLNEEELVETKEEEQEITENKQIEEEAPMITKKSNFKVKTKKKNTVLWLIIDAIIILIVAYFIVGYFNFFKISQDEEPIFKGVTSEYVKNKGIVTVHDYKIYKIVEYEIPEQTITYSMKLWFMEDVK